MKNDWVTDYWYKHYMSKGHCSLCGNSGHLDTRGVKTPTGMRVGQLHFCICPNGQALRETRRDTDVIAVLREEWGGKSTHIRYPRGMTPKNKNIFLCKEEKKEGHPSISFEHAATPARADHIRSLPEPLCKSCWKEFCVNYKKWGGLSNE